MGGQHAVSVSTGGCDGFAWSAGVWVSPSMDGIGTTARCANLAVTVTPASKTEFFQDELTRTKSRSHSVIGHCTWQHTSVVVASIASITDVAAGNSN